VNSAPWRKNYQRRIYNCDIIRLAFVCYQSRESVLYLLCVISEIVQINFLVKSGESTFIVATCDKRVTVISTNPSGDCGYSTGVVNCLTSVVLVKPKWLLVKLLTMSWETSDIFHEGAEITQLPTLRPDLVHLQTTMIESVLCRHKAVGLLMPNTPPKTNRVTATEHFHGTRTILCLPS
jgi:hypothetical protein